MISLEEGQDEELQQLNLLQSSVADHLYPLLPDFPKDHERPPLLAFLSLFLFSKLLNARRVLLIPPPSLQPCHPLLVPAASIIASGGSRIEKLGPFGPEGTTINYVQSLVHELIGRTAQASEVAPPRCPGGPVVSSLRRAGRWAARWRRRGGWQQW